MAQTFTRSRIESMVSRALEAQLVVLDMRDGFFAVESSSPPGTAYMLEMDGDGSIYCPCPGFEHTGLCVHKMSLGLHLGRIPASWMPAVNVPIDVAVAS